MNHQRLNVKDMRLCLIVLTGILWLPVLFVSAQLEQPVTIHVVQRGENLFRISLGYNLTVDAVAEANGIADPSSIEVGQRLIIPIDASTIAPEPQVKEHLVQPGESLNQIATFYGLSPEFLIERNQITNPDSLFVGQVLELDSLPTEASTTTENISPQTTQLTHVVQPGETLYRIATRYGKTVQEIQEANDISDATVIFSGQQLIIPEAEIPQFVGELPAPVTELQITPLVFIEGKTGQIKLSTASPVTVAGTFLGQELIAFGNEGRTVNVILVGIPIGTAQDIYPVQLTIVTDNGEAVPLSLNVQVLAGGYGVQYITLPDDKVSLLAPAVEQNELGILQSVTSVANPQRFFDGSMSLPAAAVMNSPFGPSRSYNGGPVDRYHNGADFAGAPGSPILAASSGKVVMVDTLNIRGLSVIIDHGWGVYTNYSHLADVFVQLGDFVVTGQSIGTVGSSGRATGAHLHWELWLRGVPVDPMQWVTERFG